MQKNKYILVIDDEEGIRESLKIFLEFEGYNVVAAANGREGLEAISIAEPSLILLDLMMPVMNGWDFAEALKETKCADTPLVIISAFTERVGTIKYNSIIGKPIDLDKLQDSIKKWG